MKPYQRGDVVIMDMPIVVGSCVQGGSRPWLIVQNNIGNTHSTTTIVCPITAKMKRLDLPTHVPFAWEKLLPGVVMCEQLRVVDVGKDWEYVTTLPAQIMEHVDRGLHNALSLKGE